MYRTGDIARQNEDGTFTYLSRRDTQIKIRGQRLDVGEVEYWITKLNASVGTAVVDLVSPNDNKTQQILVSAIDFVDGTEESNTDLAILPPSEELHSTFTALKEALRQKLFSYMIPTAFVPFAKVPLNASGKTDRRAVRKLLETHSMQELMPYASIKSAP